MLIYDLRFGVAFGSDGRMFGAPAAGLHKYTFKTFTRETPESTN